MATDEQQQQSEPSEARPSPATDPPPPAVRPFVERNTTILHDTIAKDTTTTTTEASTTLRPHIRTPSLAGLQLQTDLPMFATIVETGSGHQHQHQHQHQQLRQSASGPITMQEGGHHLRTALSAASMAGSLSPSSALSSPALNALTDITPLPSPLVVSDSPGPWARAGALHRPGSRGSSTAANDAYTMFPQGTLSPTPSLRKKGYHRLQSAAVEAAGMKGSPPRSDVGKHGRNRSVSDFAPEHALNIRPRHVTISGGPSAQVEAEIIAEPHLHREPYLASQRGIITSQASGIPTPPASNRSVTESEEEEIPEDNVQYLSVKPATGKPKKLWRPIRQLGQGTFSKVYLATSEKVRGPLNEALLDPHQLVAVKVVEHGPAGGADEERVELSLKREVEMLRSVSHPSLIHLKTFDYDESKALLVLTYCPGGDMFDVASGHRDILSVPLVQRIFAELVGAVKYLHNQLIVHRDIKLENVLLNIPLSTVPLLKDPVSHPYPLATLSDLGLSRRIPAPPASPLLTTRCGSEDYAAPEILLGQPYDGRSTDAWALGVLLYALMEGRLPFDPLPGKAGSRSRAAHRIARCDWQWCKFGDVDGEWDSEKGREWEGARLCVEGLLKKVSRGRKSVEDLIGMEWVRDGIRVDGGLRTRIEDEGDFGDR